MGKPMSEITIRNDGADSLRVVVKETGEELTLSRGEAANVFATGQGSDFPKFTVTHGNSGVEITSAHSDSILLFKSPPDFKKSVGDGEGMWDRQLDGNP